MDAHKMLTEAGFEHRTWSGTTDSFGFTVPDFEQYADGETYISIRKGEIVSINERDHELEAFLRKMGW